MTTALTLTHNQQPRSSRRSSRTPRLPCAMAEADPSGCSPTLRISCGTYGACTTHYDQYDWCIPEAPCSLILTREDLCLRHEDLYYPQARQPTARGYRPRSTSYNPRSPFWYEPEYEPGTLDYLQLGLVAIYAMRDRLADGTERQYIGRTVDPVWRRGGRHLSQAKNPTVMHFHMRNRHITERRHIVLVTATEEDKHRVEYEHIVDAFIASHLGTGPKLLNSLIQVPNEIAPCPINLDDLRPRWRHKDTALPLDFG